MLTTEQVRAEVARVTYRPGWSLTVEERGFEDPWLREAVRLVSSGAPKVSVIAY